MRSRVIMYKIQYERLEKFTGTDKRSKHWQKKRGTDRDVLMEVDERKNGSASCLVQRCSQFRVNVKTAQHISELNLKGETQPPLSPHAHHPSSVKNQYSTQGQA